MNLVDKVVIGAKKGFDWFTFADGISTQQKFAYQAIDTDSAPLQRRVLCHTVKKWIECAGVQSAGYGGLVFFANNSPQSAAFDGYMCFVGAVTLELLRTKLRMDYFANAQKHFDAQISNSLTIYDPLPPQRNTIGTDDLEPYQKDPNAWKFEKEE